MTPLACSCTPEEAFFTWSAIFRAGAGDREVSRSISARFGWRADRISSFRGGLLWLLLWLLLCSLPEEGAGEDVVRSLNGRTET